MKRVLKKLDDFYKTVLNKRNITMQQILEKNGLVLIVQFLTLMDQTDPDNINEAYIEKAISIIIYSEECQYQA